MLARLRKNLCGYLCSALLTTWGRKYYQQSADKYSVSPGSLAQITAQKLARFFSSMDENFSILMYSYVQAVNNMTMSHLFPPAKGVKNGFVFIITILNYTSLPSMSMLMYFLRWFFHHTTENALSAFNE